MSERAREVATALGFVVGIALFAVGTDTAATALCAPEMTVGSLLAIGSLSRIPGRPRAVRYHEPRG
jgi:sugar (pentulose or hexulose) kinase